MNQQIYGKKMVGKLQAVKFKCNSLFTLTVVDVGFMLKNLGASPCTMKL